MNDSERIHRVLTSLADPSRYRVLGLLLEGDHCVSELAERVGLSQSCTTRHLQIMQRAGILTRSRAGKRVLFRLNDGDPEITRLVELLLLRQSLRASAHPKTVRTVRRAGKAIRDAVTLAAPAGGMVVSDRVEVSDQGTPIPDEAPSDAGSGEPFGQPEMEDFLL